MRKDTIILLCNLTMAMAQPWVDEGFRVVMVDTQHPTGITTDGLVVRIGCTVVESLEYLGPIIRSGRVLGVFGFPPCTDVSLSGTRWWARKREADAYFQAKAAIVAEQCRVIGALAGGWWGFENPKSAFSKIFGRPQHKFHPYHFTAYAHGDCYTKETWLWTGGGFVMPEAHMLPETVVAIDLVVATLGRMVPKGDALSHTGWDELSRQVIVDHYPDNRIHEAPPDEDRSNFRSATPAGFSLAMFSANAPPGHTRMAIAA